MDEQKERFCRELISVAREAALKTYSPYSDFPVGAAVLTGDGSLYTGCNIENRSFNVSICAERTAFAKAISEGARQFKTVAVYSPRGGDCWPCGLCRQFMSEFGDQVEIIVEAKDGSLICRKLAEILPEHPQAPEKSLIKNA
ncbi:MAG: cytidine deaminase [Candidatus Obscuribacterales bacterium]|nr:cytidine deaminase [Cyanobacteria bacterium SZAS LIN-5]RTL43152.1 MAG: cytidine deaminase [Candidatus Melainabacteria bacterium]